MNRKKPFLLLMAAFVLLMAFSQSVWAFSDVRSNPNAGKINALKETGIISGLADGTFDPDGKLTYAAGVSMIVKGLALNIDHIRFIKEPQATDYFPQVNNDVWYSEAFIVAHLNGLEIPANVKPDQAMTREQFAHHLFRGVLTKGEYAFIEIFMMIEDEADVTPAYMDSIQKLLITQIAELDADQRFYPKTPITRGDAAGWLHDAIKFVAKMKDTPAAEPQQEPGTTPGTSPLDELKLSTKAVNDQVQEVTVSASAPHPGYGIRVASVTFEGKQAVIYTQTVLPDPDRMYPQVITEVSTVTYISSDYEPVLVESGQERSGSAG